jgi:hypothetical protein
MPDQWRILESDDSLNGGKSYALLMFRPVALGKGLFQLIPSQGNVTSSSKTGIRDKLTKMMGEACSQPVLRRRAGALYYEEAPEVRPVRRKIAP